MIYTLSTSKELWVDLESLELGGSVGHHIAKSLDNRHLRQGFSNDDILNARHDNLDAPIMPMVHE